jgi:hypothetical protein
MPPGRNPKRYHTEMLMTSIIQVKYRGLLCLNTLHIFFISFNFETIDSSQSLNNAMSEKMGPFLMAPVHVPPAHQAALWKLQRRILSNLHKWNKNIPNLFRKQPTPLDFKLEFAGKFQHCSTSCWNSP